jgi:C4-dicarboxylate transporter DctM subunit
MSPLLIGLLGIALFLLLLFVFRVPIGFSMAIAGFVGYACKVNVDGALSLLGMVPYSTAASYELCVIPLFVLMGYFAFHSGTSAEFFDAAFKWLGKLPGSLAIAATATAAAFASVCGSSPATAATVGAVALPEMKRYNYEPGFAAGSIAAGGTLGIMIPPSIIFVIYGLLTEQSIGQLFVAGVLPGIVLMLLYMLTIYIVVKVDPSKVQSVSADFSFREKIVSLKGTWTFLTLFLVVMVGIYSGIFTPTEAAAIGAFGAFLLAAIRRRLTRKGFIGALVETVMMTGMIFGIFIGAWLFGYFLSVTRLPMELAGLVKGLQVSPSAVMAFIILILLILGCFLDAMSMVILTTPILFPIVTAIGFDPIWFGVMTVLTVEMGLITPPVGGNVFIIAGIARDVPLLTIFRGIVPFLIADLVLAVLLIIFPQMATFLPATMRGLTK